MLNKKALAAARIASGAVTDPDFEYVTMLLHGDGTNGGQNNTFIDGSANNFTVTRNGNPTQGTFSPYAPGWSNYFDGNGDYLSTPNVAALRLGSGDFTVEAWIYPTRLTNTYYSNICGTYGFVGGVDRGWLFYLDASGNLALFMGGSSGSSFTLASTTKPTINAWSHFVAVRSGTTVTLYYNGTSIATGTSSKDEDYSVVDFNIGTGRADTLTPATGNSGTCFQGYISNLRVVKGTAVYTANFTPPTSALTAITNTSVLTCQSNRFRDNSSNNFTITRNGDVRVQPFNPFSPAAAYSAYTPAWSNYFDGNGDWLQLPSTSALVPSNFSNPFTIEGWIYPTAAGGVLFSEISTGASNPVSTAVTMSDGTAVENTSGRYIAFGWFTGTTWGTAAMSNSEVALNAWSHVAVVFTGSTSRIYVNGVDVTKTSSPTPASVWGVSAGSGDGFYIGRRWDLTANVYFTGYISNLRFVKGSAVYTAPFVPSTGPLTAIANTSLLTCQSSGFTDNSSNALTITANGNVVARQFSPFPVSAGAGGSNFFDGAGDYLSVADNAALQLTGDFSIEFWVYVAASTGGNQVFLSKWNGSSQGYIIYYNQFNGKIEFASTAGGTLSSSTSFSLQTWNHVAAVRTGNTYRLFLNGLSVASSTSSATATDSGTVLWVGRNNANSQNDTNGHISNLRIIKGTGGYDASQTSITVPTAPLDAITNTSLLTCQTRTGFVDRSTNAFAITVNGNVSAQEFNPFSTNAVASAGTNGGSGYFDGTGDSLTAPTNAAFEFGTGDFTLEAWVNLANASSSVYRMIFEIAYSTTKAVTIRYGDGGFGQRVQFGVQSDTFGTIYSASQTQSDNVNVWRHIAFTRQSGVCRLFLNGILQSIGSGTNPVYSSTSFTDNTNVTGLTLVRVGDGTAGYISDARVIKGAALYTANFTPPTAPLTAVNNTSLLLNFTNGAIIDNAMDNALETVGNAQISTSVKKFGTGSLSFDGTGDSLFSSYSQDTDIGGAAFTVECWLYTNNISFATYQAVLSKRIQSGTTAAGFTFGIKSDGKVIAWNGTSEVGTSGITLQSTTWYHVAWVYSGTVLKMFVNGTEYYSASYTIAANPYPVQIGCASSGGVASDFFNGYIDDLRITKGVARYTANFTPPTAAFPDL